MANYIYDYETICNCFIAYFENAKDENDNHTFIIHQSQNDLPKFKKFIKEGSNWLTGFNNLGFDSQVTQDILTDSRVDAASGAVVAQYIYDFAQDAITRSNGNSFAKYPAWKLSTKELDIFKVNHWDSGAKRTSLKWAQYSMNWDNILDMPLPHDKPVTAEDIPMIVEYCKNDVKSTKALYKLSSKQISLRKTLTKTYNLNLLNASEPKISKDIFMKFLSKKTGIDSRVLKHFRTPRPQIKVVDIMLDYYKFKIPEYKNVYDKFKTLVLDGSNLKGAIKFDILKNGVTTTFGLGGIHGAASSGVYEKEPGWIIMSSDVTSYYPNLAIRNGWSPSQIPSKEFLEQYEWFFDERRTIPKSNVLNYVYKIILNSTYGLSNDKHSYLYDPLFTLQITINGQLSLLMLCDDILSKIPTAKIILQNTDGIEFKIPEKDYDLYISICESWEKRTKLFLEHERYQKLIIADVNNYIALKEFEETTEIEYANRNNDVINLYSESDGKYYKAGAKCKGRFEWKPFEDFELTHIHKNRSGLIVPKALFNYFIHDIIPEDFIYNSTDIFEFCMGVKMKSDSNLVFRTIRGGKLIQQPLQKTNRYFVSENGVKLIKKYGSGKEEQVVAGKWLQTVYNRHIYNLQLSSYNINYPYYIKKVYDEINKITGISRNTQQLNLF